MPLNAKKFIQNRGKGTVSITYNRIQYIMSYAIECYQILLIDKPIYSKSHVAKHTTYHFEDYLKMEFVDGYLVKNKHLLTGRASSLDDITFNYETIKRFTDLIDGKDKSDKIDVYVNRLGLKDKWAVPEEHLYLAIECKRITTQSDCKDYIEDIQKFCDREHKQLRIPFESQIAFIENSKLTHASVSNEINCNRRLNLNFTITTLQYLKAIKIHSSFLGSYSSVHKKNYKKKDTFEIFHLLLDYSELVTA